MISGRPCWKGFRRSVFCSGDPVTGWPVERCLRVASVWLQVGIGLASPWCGWFTVGSVADPNLEVFGGHPRFNVGSKAFKVVRRPVSIKCRLVGVLLIEKTLGFVVAVEANVELMAVGFLRQRVVGLLLNSIAELADRVFFNGELNGDDVHCDFRGLANGWIVDE